MSNNKSLGNIPAADKSTSTSYGSFGEIDADSLLSASIDGWKNALQRGDGDLAAGFNDITQNDNPPHYIWIPPGKHDVTDSLDLTEFTAGQDIGVLASGAYLNPTSAVDNYPVVDCTGSHQYLVWYGPTIIRDGGNAPGFGVLEARNGDTYDSVAQTSDSAGRHRWQSVTVDGEFTHAPWYVLASESNVYDHVQVFGKNGSAVGTEACAFGYADEDTGSDFLNATSKWSNPDGRGGNKGAMFHKCAIWSMDNSKVEDAIAINGHPAGVTFRNTYVNGGSRSAIHLRGKDQSAGLTGPLSFENTIVEDDPTYGIYVSAMSNPVSNITIDGGEWRSTNSEIYSEARVNNWSIRGKPINLTNNGTTLIDKDIQRSDGNWGEFTPISIGTGFIDECNFKGVSESDVTANNSAPIYKTTLLENLDSNASVRLTFIKATDKTIIDQNGVTHTPINLAGKTGNRVGEIRHDDGTNTVGSGLPCSWTGTAWQPHDGSATFT